MKECCSLSFCIETTTFLLRTVRKHFHLICLPIARPHKYRKHFRNTNKHSWSIECQRSKKNLPEENTSEFSSGRYKLDMIRRLKRLDDLGEEGCHLVGGGVGGVHDVVTVVYIVVGVVVMGLVGDDGDTEDRD